MNEYKKRRGVVSKLLLNNFDGTMKNLNLTPKFKNSKVEFNIKFYDEEDKITKGILIFKGVIAIDFEVNYFDTCIGSELCGFYEIFETNEKVNLIEKIFLNKKERVLYHGDYNYDEDDEYDWLNYREVLNEIIKDIDNYHFYQQKTQGGIFNILALEYELIIK